MRPLAIQHLHTGAEAQLLRSLVPCMGHILFEKDDGANYRDSLVCKQGCSSFSQKADSCLVVSFIETLEPSPRMMTLSQCCCSHWQWTSRWRRCWVKIFTTLASYSCTPL